MKRYLCFLFWGIMLLSCVADASTLTGIVVDAQKSTPISGASVSVDVLIPDSISFYASSDPSGSYSVSGIPGGNAIYVIRCYAAGYADFYMRYDALALGDRQVDIVLDPQPVVPPGGGGGGDSTSISGIILYETSPGGARNPVNQATVTLKSGGMQFSSRTGGDGRYSLSLRRGMYSVSVEAPTFATLTAGSVEVDSSGLTLNILLNSVPVMVPGGTDAVPESFTLGNAYPNPFNPTTTIQYTVGVVGGQPSAVSDVRMVVYDVLGREVAVLVNGRRAAGTYEVRFSAKGGSASGGDASALMSGVYIYRLTAGPYVECRKMVLLK